MFLRKYFLWPLGLLYGLIMEIRNFFYDYHYFSVYQSKIFTISVGNLSVGGTGKTPHIEYLIRYFLDRGYNIAVLSRGYGRKTNGFIEVLTHHQSSEVGDEPLQIKQKFLHQVSVFVCENRVLGVKKIENIKQKIDVLLLDDAFQHRSIQPHLQIVLSDFEHLIDQDWVLPAGNLREFPYQLKRADLILITKTPKDLKLEIREQKIKNLKNLNSKIKNIPILFTKIVYGNFFDLKNRAEFCSSIFLTEKIEKYVIFLITGIAKSAYFCEDLKLEIQNKHQILLEMIHWDFPDHHVFSFQDVEKINHKIQQIKMKYRQENIQFYVLTTEKDAVKLANFDFLDQKIYFRAIQIDFLTQNMHDQFQNYLEKKYKKN